MFSPRSKPSSRGCGNGQNLISLRWFLPLPTNPVWWGSMHAISSYRGNRPNHTQKHTHTHPPTHRQDRLQYTASQLARCKEMVIFRPESRAKHSTRRNYRHWTSSYSQTLVIKLLGQPVVCRSHW